jgi:hypothetical protein
MILLWGQKTMLELHSFKVPTAYQATSTLVAQSSMSQAASLLQSSMPVKRQRSFSEELREVHQR